VHVAERYGTLVNAYLHYGDNHTTITTDDPNEMRDFAGVAAEMTLLRNVNREGKPVPDNRSGPAVRAT
jgi:hypothetical protein